MWNALSRRLLALLFITMITVAASVAQAAPTATSDREFNIWNLASVGFSVQAINSYEVQLQKNVGGKWERKYSRSNVPHMTFFYGIESGTYRVVLIKRDNVVVNKVCDVASFKIPLNSTSLYKVDCPN